MKNRLRRKLQQGEATYGIWVTLESPSVSEIAADLGLDWVCVDTEHGHLDYKEVMEHARALHGADTTLLVRVPDISRHLIKRVIDIGAQGVLLPLVRSADDVREGFMHARYPGAGSRGLGGERAVRWGLQYDEYLQTANEEIMVIPLIETREAVDHIDDILAVPGLEAVFFGPADLSASYGYLGEWEGLGVADRIADVATRAVSRKVAVGVIGRNLADLQRRREQGFQILGLGSDVGLMIERIQETLGALGIENQTHDWF